MNNLFLPAVIIDFIVAQMDIFILKNRFQFADELLQYWIELRHGWIKNFSFCLDRIDTLKWLEIIPARGDKLWKCPAKGVNVSRRVKFRNYSNTADSSVFYNPLDVGLFINVMF